MVCGSPIEIEWITKYRTCTIVFMHNLNNRNIKKNHLPVHSLIIWVFFKPAKIYHLAHKELPFRTCTLNMGAIFLQSAKLPSKGSATAMETFIHQNIYFYLDVCLLFLMFHWIL